MERHRPRHICLCLLLVAVLTAPALAIRQQYDTELDLSMGFEFGDIDRWRLSVDSGNNVTSQSDLLSGFFFKSNMFWKNRFMFDVRDNLVVDVKSDWTLAFYDPETTNSERYNLLSADNRVQLGYSQSDRTLWVTNLYFRTDRQELYPLLSSSTAGFDVALDRMVGSHVFYTLKLGTTATDLTDTYDEWDHRELFFRALYTNVAPERTAVDALPAHPLRYSSRDDMFFETSDILGLWRSRPTVRNDGKARRILESLPPGPPPPTQDLKVDVKINDSVFAGGFGFTDRRYDNLLDQGFIQADAEAYVRWNLGRNLALTFNDRFAWQDYDREDGSRLLHDHWENDFNLYLTHSRPRQHFRIDAKLKTVVFDTADQWSFNTSRIGGTWDYRDRKRFSYTVRTWYTRDIPHSERAGNTYTKDLRLFGAFRVHFSPHRFMRFSWEREREIVSKVQSEFDSSYNQDTYEVKYRHRLNPTMTWEAGFSVEKERHEIFYQNNRDEELGFLNLLVHL